MICQSLPFELNMKMNAYMTINDQNQFTYIQKGSSEQEECLKRWKTLFSQDIEKYFCFCPIGFDLSISLYKRNVDDKNTYLKDLKICSGNLTIVNSEAIKV